MDSISMIKKPYLIFGIGIIALFTGVVYTMANATNTMIAEQTKIADARFQGEIGDAEFQRLSRKSEVTYRNTVADALGRIESKFQDAAKVVGALIGLAGSLPKDEEPEIRLIDQKVNITLIGEDDYAVFLNGTPYPLEDLYLNVTDNNTVVMKVIVVEQNNYYQYYPYLRGNMSEILNISGSNYSADLESIAANLSTGIESFRTDRIT